MRAELENVFFDRSFVISKNLILSYHIYVCEKTTHVTKIVT